MGFFRGFVAPFRGAVFVARERLWHLVLLPLLFNIGLAVGSAWAAARYWKAEFAGRVFSSPFVQSVSFVAVTFLLAVLLFVVLQPLLGAIFNDRLTERVERKVLGQVPQVAFLTSLGRALAHGILKLALYALALLVGTLVSVVTGGIGAAVGVGLGALFLAYDGFDYPLARRAAGFLEKWRYLALHPAQTIGYGLGSTVFYLIPLALIVAPPLTAVGATLVYLETESRREKAKTKLRPEPIAETKIEPKTEKGRVDETSPLRDGQG
jgi:uncharacterized protein involved in cysteine biosynthesis